jgi:hypothetical protein
MVLSGNQMVYQFGVDTRCSPAAGGSTALVQRPCQSWPGWRRRRLTSLAAIIII